MADNSTQRSSLKEFLASVATIKGDLSNITAPPFVLADKSTTEFPRYWIEHSELFCAPAKEQDPEKRILAVLKWFLSSLKGQSYAGRDPRDGVKKPLNAFLGEVFTGSSGSESDECHLVSEQVSHHPPVTACYLWNDKAGIRAEGFTRQEITFNGSVNIQQIGHAVLHIDSHNEDYLIPLPNLKVKGVLTGGPYPELTEPCTIVSSAGYVAEVDFSGKKVLGFGGEKNHVQAAIYRSDDKKRKHALFTAEGNWTETLTFKDSNGTVVETYDVASAPATEFRTQPLDKQDPWESRKAWNGVITSINGGDMKGVADHKSELENAQRELRKKPETSEDNWKPIFFRKEKSDPVARKLLDVAGAKFDPESTCGIWRFEKEKAEKMERPWRAELTPYG
ncbi:hypothetical protein LTR37_013703 [Vermiconidia calcicola]|uniref:Uncharacterized protein n=1 Tax=Vermiconidia calcicola TaxID=1690605 RepID=A0ACC3MVT8_9PEZI|nr:hypothetical protein LTR37_013703 [Vermiconidia calcicola]